MNSIIIPMTVSNLAAAAGGTIETSESRKSKKKDTDLTAQCFFGQVLPLLSLGMADTTMPLVAKIAGFAMAGGIIAAWCGGDQNTKHICSFIMTAVMAVSSFVFAFIAFSYLSSPLNIVLGLANLAAGCVQIHNTANSVASFREFSSQSAPS